MKKNRQLIAGIAAGIALGLIVVPLAMQVDYVAELILVGAALGLALLGLAKLAGKIYQTAPSAANIRGG